MQPKALADSPLSGSGVLRQAHNHQNQQTKVFQNSEQLNKLRNYLPPDEVDVVVYHFPCHDGFGGAYCFWRYISCNPEIDIDSVEFIGMSHSMCDEDINGSISQKLLGKNVVFVDLVPRSSVLEDLVINYPKKAVVLDHHAGAQKTLQEFPKILKDHVCFDLSKSGATLAWEYCYPSDDPPELLKLIEDRDTWSGNYPETNAFATAFYKAVPFDFEEFEKYEDPTELEKIIEEGKILLKYQKMEIVQQHAPNAVPKKITIDKKTYNVFVINTNVLISDIGAYLAKQRFGEDSGEMCDFALMWVYNHKRGLVKVSLRSDKDRQGFVDVAEIAKNFGGNGHPAAAGFCIQYPDIIDKVVSLSSNSSVAYEVLKACGLVALGGVFGGAAVFTADKFKK